jgi:hypothetical protein
MTLNKPVLILISILIIGGIGVLVFLQKTNEQLTNEAEKVTELEKEFNESGQAKAITDETDLWKVYESKDAGFSIKYPTTVNFEEKTADGLYDLSIETANIDTLEGTLGFDKETAKQNLESLKNGEYGKKVDWPLDGSEKVVKIGNTYAQEFAVFSRFEVCSVIFERKLYFFNDNYQIIITLAGPKEKIIDSSPDYFKIDKENCGSEKVWNFDRQKEFFTNLKNNNGSEIALNWFNTFDKIIGTIEFNESQTFNSDLLLGKWVSLDDANSEIEFIGKKKIDYYQNQKVSEGDYVVQDEKYLTVTEDGEEFRYSIVELSDKSLALTYLSRGNTLRYKKV